MSAQMTVVYLEHTGHVVAALREPDSGAPKLEAMVGTGFPLGSVRRTAGSTSSASFDIPASVLKSKSLVLDDRVIARPQSFAIDGDRVAELPVPPTTTTTLSQADVTVKLAAVAGAEVKVLTVVRGPQGAYREQRIQAGLIKAGEQDVVLNLAIVPTGPSAALAGGLQCDIAVVVAGFAIDYASDST